MFEHLQGAIRQALATCAVAPTSSFGRFVQDELAHVPVTADAAALDRKQLYALYDLRAQYLDWELGTGYLGYFSPHAGTRYAFTRIKTVVYDLLREARVPSAARILEVGCGAGFVCLDLARSAGTVVGLDVSRRVVAFARTVQQYARQENVLFQVGDAEALMFRDQTFDVVLCSEVLEHLVSPERALAEMRRVVKPSGAVVLTTPCAVSVADSVLRLCRRFTPRIEAGQDVHFDKKTYLALRRNGAHAPAASFLRIHTHFRYREMVARLRQAGFAIASVKGAVAAFPPHSQVFYRYCPAIVLPAIRLLEDALNRCRIFPRFGSLTTCFRLQPV